MRYANFDEATLHGENRLFADLVLSIKERYQFDFAAIGLTAFPGAPLKWVYSAGSTSKRHERIVLAPGHGIGGIVLKAGKPMLCVNIEQEMDPREYSSYPIVFAEDLHGFFALPLLAENGRVTGVVLCAQRSPRSNLAEICETMIGDLQGRIGNLKIVHDSFIDFDALARMAKERESDLFLGSSQISRIVSGQEEARRSIARDLHDGVGQELLALSFSLAQLEGAQDMDQVREEVDKARSIIEAINDQIHNISVDLRPSTLDHFGLASALRSTFTVYEGRFGARITLEAPEAMPRFSGAHETQVYRIIQEAVLNACKYSGSEEIRVVLEVNAGWLNASIIDDGSGFDPQRPVVRGSGCGLDNMRERAALAGGDIEITSNETGTVVRLVAPLVFNATAEEEE